MTSKNTDGARKSIRILLVDDYESWRRFVRSTVQIRPEYQVIGEVSDGLEAVQTAQELQPDLIVLDIGLPTLNGIEAARRIRTHSPQSKILFLSENRSLDVAGEALRSGGNGYVLKSDAAGELVLAVEAVLRGNRFVSASLGEMSGDRPDPSFGYRPSANNVMPFSPGHTESPSRHEVTFYSDDCQFLDRLTLFVGTALNIGNAAIVVATESHRIKLIPRLQAYGVNIAAAIERGRYLAFDATDALSTFIVNGMPDPTQFLKTFANLILTAASAADSEPPRVAIFGECVHLLCAHGNPEAAIQLEKLGNQLTSTYDDVDILCGYCLGTLQSGMDEHVFQQICAEHSAVYSH